MYNTPDTSEILTTHWSKYFGKNVAVKDSVVIFPTHDGPAIFIIKLAFLKHIEISFGNDICSFLLAKNWNRY